MERTLSYIDLWLLIMEMNIADQDPETRFSPRLFIFQKSDPIGLLGCNQVYRWYSNTRIHPVYNCTSAAVGANLLLWENCIDNITFIR